MTQKVEVIRMTGLVKLDAATRALAKATDIREIKQIRDVAEAIRKLAKTAGAGLDIQNEGAMLKIRAECKGGEKLKGMERQEAGRPEKGNTVLPLIPTLKDLNLTKVQSSRWQAESDIPEKVQEEYFKQAKEKDLEITTAGFMREGQKNKPKPETPKMVDGEYGVVYADPPWEYDFSSTTSREIENKYPTMTVDEIKKMALPKTKNAVLYLWATAPKLLEALSVVAEWGFDYKTCMIWDKEIIGMGYWFRGQHELLLVGTKGNFSPPKQKLRVSSVLRERRTQHSRKPIIIKEWINTWYPEQNKIELFARENTQGWISWGNQL